MIKFVDLETGKVFDGNKPYIFWFKDGQSTHLVHSMRIALLLDKKTYTTICIDLNSPVFSLISNAIGDPSDTINDVKYVDLDTIKTSSISLKPANLYTVGTRQYLYIFNIVCSNDSIGQYTDEFTVTLDNEVSTFTVGADFYDEDESLLINLANQGQEIPESVSKALYSTNVHEDYNDNIVLNRKWKELLLNSWDTFVCKGSYKSLINCLKWFEYGDNISISEYWKFIVAGKQFLSESNLSSILTDKYKDSLSNFAKTTYIGIHGLLDEKVYNSETCELEYDDDWDKNPKLQKAVYAWSAADMTLKLSMLGNFYETYFMPIHLDLIQSTMEDVVYTVAIKNLCSGGITRDDYAYDLSTFECSVKDGDEFIITNINAQVGPSTMFGRKYEWKDKGDVGDGQDSYKNVYTIGVDEIVEDSLEDDTDMQTFWAQYINYPGTIVPFHCEIDTYENDDCIHTETISFLNSIGEEVMYSDHKLVRVTDSNFVVDFNLLYFEPGHYSILLQFLTTSGRKYVKRVSFEVIDNGIPNFHIYKIVAKDDNTVGGNGLAEFAFKPDAWKENNAHTLLVNGTARDCFNDSSVYKQYLPYKEDPDKNGIRLVSYVVIEFTPAEYDAGNLNTIKKEMEKDGYECVVRTVREIPGDDTSNVSKYYLMCLAKTFDKTFSGSVSKGKIYRNDRIFYPPYHDLVEICETPKDGTEPTLDDFTISQTDAICIIPTIDNGSVKGYENEYSRPLRYTLNDGTSTNWTFYNVSEDSTSVVPPYAQPVISDKYNKALEKGYYNIQFDYKLSTNGPVHTIKRNSTIRVK